VSKNRSGGFTRQTTGKEWGSKARKEEADIRGLNNRARFEAIAEQVADINDTEAL
jgi:hypothetical protein